LLEFEQARDDALHAARNEIAEWTAKLAQTPLVSLIPGLAQQAAPIRALVDAGRTDEARRRLRSLSRSVVGFGRNEAVRILTALFPGHPDWALLVEEALSPVAPAPAADVKPTPAKPSAPGVEAAPRKPSREEEEKMRRKRRRLSMAEEDT
jgi:hypothetical protein